MRWAEHVARMEKGELYTGFRWGDLRGSDLLEDPGIRWEDNIKMDHIKRGRGGGWTG